MLTVFNTVKPFVVEEKKYSDPKESIWWRKWSNGFVEAGGQFVPVKYPQDQYGAYFYKLPFRVLKHYITLVSAQSNSTSSWFWRSGYALTNYNGDYVDVSIRGKFVDFATGVQVPTDQYTEAVSWSFSGYLEP